MSAQSKDSWKSFVDRQQASDGGSDTGTGFSRGFFQSNLAVGNSGCPRFGGENVSSSSPSYTLSNQRHSTKPGVLGDRNNLGHLVPSACSLDLSRFQSQPFLGQRSEFVTSPSGVSTSSSSSVEVSRVKKPLNAFMLFLRETRRQAADELGLKDSAVINQVLGRKWNSMVQSEKMKYYDMASQEQELHRRLHPLWTPKDNYGMKRKRRKRKDPFEEGVSFFDVKKCRARFGTTRQLWCKSCRLKKRCVRFLDDNSKENDSIHSASSRLDVSDGFHCGGLEGRRAARDVRPMENGVPQFQGGFLPCSSACGQSWFNPGGFDGQGYCGLGFSADYGAQVQSVPPSQSHLYHGRSDEYLRRDCWSVPEDTAPNLGNGSQGQPYGGFGSFVLKESASSSTPLSWNVQPQGSCHQTCRQGSCPCPADYSVARPCLLSGSMGPRVVESYDDYQQHQPLCQSVSMTSEHEMSSSFASVEDQGLGSCSGFPRQSLQAVERTETGFPMTSEDGFVVALGRFLATFLMMMILLALLVSALAFVTFACFVSLLQ